MLDIVFCILIIVLGFSVRNLLNNKTYIQYKNYLTYLWLYHIAFAVLFYIYTQYNSADATGYWRNAKEMKFFSVEDFFSSIPGTRFIYYLNYLPAKVLDLSYFTGTIIYCFIGFIGSVLFYITAIQIIPYNSVRHHLFPALFFLPNFHFWSAGIGKDTLLFFCIGLFTYGLLKMSKRLPLIIFSLALSYCVRPHITLFLLFSCSLAYLFEAKISRSYRIFFTLFLIGIGLVILPAVMEYAKIEEVSVSAFNKFAETKVSALSGERTTSSIDISSYPLLLKILTFLYRPLFFDVNNVLGIFASFENLILLYLTIRVLNYRVWHTFKQAPFVVKSLLLFLIIGTLAFSNSLGNLGIMIRMKNMFLPAIIIYILWSFSLKTSDSLYIKPQRNFKD